MREQILTRLSRGPASESSLARWCDLPQARHIRPVLARMRAERCIHRIGGRYSRGIPAGRIVIGRGSRWRVRFG